MRWEKREGKIKYYIHKKTHTKIARYKVNKSLVNEINIKYHFKILIQLYTSVRYTDKKFSKSK